MDLIIVIVYVIGMAVAYGYTGGIRDEMDGIIDLLTIAFWPLAIIIYMLSILLKACSSFGALIRGSGTNVEICLSVDAVFLEGLQTKLGYSKPADLTKIGLSLLDWASAEAAQNRIIMSASTDGSDARRLVMTELTTVKSACANHEFMLNQQQ